MVQQVTLIEFAEQLKADAVLVAKLRSLPNVAIHTSAQTTEIVGDGQKVTGLRYKDRASGTEHTIELAGVFVQIGLVPNTEWLKGAVELSKYGEIIVDARNATSAAGVFAAGDATDLASERRIPRAADADGGGEARRLGVQQSADALVGEIHRHAEPRAFDEPALHLVEGAHMLRPRKIEFRVGQASALAGVAVQVFVDVADAVLPKRLLPRWRRQFVLRHPREPIPCGHLRGLFLQRHAREQIRDPRLHVQTTVFVRIPLPVLIQIDPAVAINRRHRLLLHEPPVARPRLRRQPSGATS